MDATKEGPPRRRELDLLRAGKPLYTFHNLSDLADGKPFYSPRAEKTVLEAEAERIESVQEASAPPELHQSSILHGFDVCRHIRQKHVRRFGRHHIGELPRI